MSHALKKDKDFLHVIIIGNGFDLAHELKTKYTDFLQHRDNTNILSFIFNFVDSLKAIEKEFPNEISRVDIQQVEWALNKLFNYSELTFEQTIRQTQSQIKQITEAIIEFFHNKEQFCTKPYLTSILYPEDSKENWFNIERKIYEYIRVLCDENTSKNIHAFKNYRKQVDELKQKIGHSIDEFNSLIRHMKGIVPNENIKGDPLSEIFAILKIDNNTERYNLFKEYVDRVFPISSDIGKAFGCQFAYDNAHWRLCSFVDAFRKYLSNEVSKPIETLKQTPKFDFCLKELERENTNPQKHKLWVLNFNYTQTFEQLYQRTLEERGVKVQHCHIHGALGEENLVLGCQSFDPADKINPAWNVFTKHHQRHRYGTIEKYQELLKELRHFKGEVAFHILGHSLDEADHAILKHALCSSHNTAVQDSFISVYYHDEEAHLRLINNITDIIGEEDVMARVRFIDQHDPKRGILKRVHETSKNQ